MKYRWLKIDWTGFATTKPWPTPMQVLLRQYRLSIIDQINKGHNFFLELIKPKEQ